MRKQYRESGSRIVHVETGESKPAYRRVQFKRGTSSTTVQGKVSIALPDTYLVGARAGQVMTVAAHRTAQVGEVSVDEPVHERSSTYSITISIK